MSSKQLDELMKKIQEGDEESFDALYDQINRGVFSFIYTFVGNPSDAEDLMQETFVRVKRHAQSYKLGTNVSAWVLQIAKNLSLDFLKKQKELQKEDLLQNVAFTNTLDTTDKLFVHDLLNRCLEEQERQIVVLIAINGYKHREVAKFLKIPLGTVLWKYNKAVKKLNKKYTEALNEKF